MKLELCLHRYVYYTGPYAYAHQVSTYLVSISASLTIQSANTFGALTFGA